ncbi:hypothetical protein LMJ53_04200 [Rheinheimera sp. UJ51]|uniref:hypothetical protein n=1 Tax=unclassified Rheinheimera TaxID=115860 RepID=UPI001E5AC591|nr:MULTISPECIES: hypothetical protein [unclassified Rheinheimera]MCC5450939.1 hypothetical protein [Rheinheimera sp. UJ51]MCF4007994.1 hypothetical protein [Rheinheimera sp. UJ63]
MKYVVLAWLLCCSHFSYADFKYHGQLQLQTASGEQRQQIFTLQLKREAGAYEFTVGQQQSRFAMPPQSYSLALILQDDSEVWVTDFINQPLHGFTLQLGQYLIKLSKDDNARSARGRFVLEINDESYYFSKGPAQINFNLSDNGINELQVRGMFKPKR